MLRPAAERLMGLSVGCAGTRLEGPGGTGAGTEWGPGARAGAGGGGARAGPPPRGGGPHRLGWGPPPPAYDTDPGCQDWLKSAVVSVPLRSLEKKSGAVVSRSSTASPISASSGL